MVSVVVAAYNEERWIADCLASLVAQSEPGLEIVVVDDGSTDASGAIAAGFGVRVLRTEHRGAGAARAAGAAVARGDVLVFLDADEIYDPGFVAALVAPLRDPAVTGTFPGSVTWHNERDGLARGWLRVRGGGGPQRYGETHPFPKALRRADYERAGGYPAVGHGEDAEFGMRTGPALVVPDARFRFTLPTGAGEVFGKARWIGRGPRFERERPPLRRLTPPWSVAAAGKLLLRDRDARAAVVRLVYDAGLLVGFAESRIRPRLRQIA